MAVPAGVLAVIGWRGGARNSALVACALVVVFFGCAEAAQVFVRSRTADVVDFLVNVSGAATGVLLAIQLVPHRRGSYGRARRRRVLGGALAVMAGLYVVYNWSPFDFTWSSAIVEGRASRLWAVPFASYYQNAEFKALSDATVKLCLSAPFGILIQLLIGRPAQSAASMAAVVASAIFFAVVETGQLLLPSRFPDNTDVLLATGGVLAAMHLTRRFQASAVQGILPVRRAVPVVLAADSRLVWRTPSGGEIRKRRRSKPAGSRRAE
jgi:VanZ family protein